MLCVCSLLVLKGGSELQLSLILNDGRGFPDIATIIFFSEKFVF